MLDVLRRNAGSWVIKIILGFIAVTFVWWGVGTYSERGRDIAATVGSQNISMGELAEAAAGLEKTYRDVYGAALTPEMAKTLNFRKQAMDSLIQRALFLSEAKKMGISASDEEVQREIAATPAFQVNGQFHAEQYQATLKYNRITTASYEESKRQEITLKKMEGLFAADARVPESEALELFRLATRKVRLLVVTADPDKIKGVVSPTEGEIAAKYDQMKESLRIPARVKLLAARFEPAFFARDASVTEQEIRAFYEGNADKFRNEEQRLVSQIYLPYAKKDKEAVAKKMAEILVEAGKGKAEFEKTAKKHSKMKTGETWTRRSEARPEVAGPLYAAAVDSLVGPIDVGGGILLLRVNRIQFPETLPLDKVKDRVTALLKREKGKDIAVIKAYEAHTKASASKDLKGACAPYGIAPAETGWSGGSKEDAVPPAVVQEALMLPVKEIGPVKSIGDVHYLFQVVAKEESRIPAQAEVREKIVSAVSREKRRAAAQAELQKILPGTNTAAELAQGAKQAGLPAATTALFAPLSDTLPESLPPSGEMRKTLLSLSRKAPVLGKAVEASGRFLALALSEEKGADEKEWVSRKDSFLRSVAEQKKNQMIEAFLAERRVREKVEINPEALK
ncbi:MAG: SurA N-terminal domain-containing protein [Deltaproteobacteria bacterium]|nr:SurA N-terminal domain-containing protein [Deltaproteobacteria bacterium]